jgi:hypothetical protein
MNALIALMGSAQEQIIENSVANMYRLKLWKAIEIMKQMSKSNLNRFQDDHKYI